MRSRRYLYRCDAGEVPEIGTGHLRRGLLIAKELWNRHGIKTTFLMRKHPIASEMIGGSGSRLITIREGVDDRQAILKTVSVVQPDAVILDMLDTDRNLVRSIQQTGRPVITMDDHGTGSGAADMVINSFDLDGEGGAPYSGLDYMVLPPGAPLEKHHREKAEVIFVSFGGYDHLDLTMKTLRAIDALDGNLKTVVVMRRMSPNSTDVESFTRERRSKFELFFDVRAITEIMNDADIAIVSGGLTLFEAMRCGLPCVVMAQYGHQLKTAGEIEKRNAAICLGRGDRVNEERIQEVVKPLLTNWLERERLGERARTLVNSEGLMNTVDLMAIVEERAWDTKFFGRGIARLNPARISEGIVRYALKVCEESDFECLYYLADFTDPASVELAERHGFHLVDMRVRMVMDLSEISYENGEGNGVEMRSAADEDRCRLEEIAEGSFRDSRFFFDSAFPEEDCRRLYRVWIRNSLKGRYGNRDRVFVAELEGEVVGFVSCDIESPSTGRVVLVGVGQEFQGKSVGITMLRHVLRWMAGEGCSHVEVVTQGRNLAAQALYQRTGFRTVEARLWYHKWF